MRVNTDELGTGSKIAIILVVCCIGVLIIGMAANIMSPDQNTNTAPATTTSSDNSTSSANTSTSNSNGSSDQVYTSGTYKVGQDIPAGEYKFTQTDEYGGYIERSSDSSMEFDSIISNDATSEKGETAYVTVHDGEYLKIDGGELVKSSSSSSSSK